MARETVFRKEAGADLAERYCDLGIQIHDPMHRPSTMPTRDQRRDERQTWRRGPSDDDVRPLVPHSRPAYPYERRRFARQAPTALLTRAVFLLRSNEVHRVSMSAEMVRQFTEKDARWCGIGREVLIQEKEAHAVNWSASR
jgi:hypothetical protein